MKSTGGDLSGGCGCGGRVPSCYYVTAGAKGRVGRTSGTAQDRLVKGMRLARTTKLEAANRYLEERWAPIWNERFTVVRRPCRRRSPAASGLTLATASYIAWRISYVAGES